MSSARAQSPVCSRYQGVVAGLLAALVFILGLLAASPASHAWIHASEHSHASHAPHDHAGAHNPASPHAVADGSACAVTLFQQGVTPLLTLPRLAAPRPAWTAMLPAQASTPHPSAPAYRLQPARGPPVLA